MKGLEKVVGSWSQLLAEEFRRPYLKELSKKTKERQSNLFLEFFPKGDIFQIFKNSDPNNIKVVFIVEKPELEKDILDSLWEHTEGDCSVLVENDYQWLVDQGIFFLPKYLSWDEEGVHKEWREFTESVLLQLTLTNNVLVITSDMLIAKLLFEFRPWVDRISTHKPWGYIEEWVAKHHKHVIEWKGIQV